MVETSAAGGTTLGMRCSAKEKPLTAQKHIPRLVTFPLIMDVTTSQKEILTFVYMAGPETRWLNITS